MSFLGIYIVENMNLEPLSADRCYEFLFLCLPLRFQGATASWVRPLALRQQP
jgi:kynurenine formamidase